MAVRVWNGYGVHEVSITGKGTPRDQIQITQIEKNDQAPAATDLEIENRVLRLLIYDLKSGERKLKDL